MRFVRNMAAVFVACWCSAAVAQEARASFERDVGPWQIAGDKDVGGCLMIPRALTDTRLTFAILPARDTIMVALSNPAWASLPESDDARIDATFSDSKGEITDSWSLAATFTSRENGGPRVNVEIDRAKNDQTSFVDQLRKAHRLTFWRQGKTLMLGSYDLQGSAAAIDALLACREHLRASPNFDPFAD